MSTSSTFDKPRFQGILQYFLNTNCDMESQLTGKQESVSFGDKTANLPMVLKKSLKVFIIEMIPQILISDGHNFIEAVFTKESINEFRKTHSHVKFSSLRDKLIHVTKWSLLIDHADSKKEFNSCSNLSIKIAIEQFSPKMHETLTSRITHTAHCIFKEPTI